MAKGRKKKPSKAAKHVQLIVSDSPKPTVALEVGMQVASVSLIKPSGRPAGAVAARLCGGTSTCIALIKVDNG